MTFSETNGRYAGDVQRSSGGEPKDIRSRPAAGDKQGSGPRPEYVLLETDITDLTQAASRIEALRSLILILLREFDSLKRVVGPRQRKKGDPIKLDRELDAFEASLIRDALIKSGGHQRNAAKLLSIKPSTLNARIKRLGITVETTVTGID